MSPSPETESPALSPVQLAVLGGLAVGGKLRDSHIVELTELGATLPEEMTKERWLAFLTSLRQVKKSYEYCLADAITFGVRRFGKEFVQGVLDQLQFPFEEQEGAMAVASSARSLRDAFLTSGHFLQVINLTDEEKERWLSLAVTEQLTPFELHHSIHAGKVVRDARGRKPQRTGILNLPGVILQLDRWGKSVKLDDFSDDDLEAAAEELHVAVELERKIRTTLASRGKAVEA